MTTEQRLAEIIQAFCAYALSSTVNLNLNIDLDVMLCVLAQALLRIPQSARPRIPHRRTRHLPARFLDTAVTITSDGDTITTTPQPTRLLIRSAPIRPAHRHHHPRRQNRRLRFQFS
jgi:hypothetical protein